MTGYAPHTFNPQILREYDIRGRVGKALSRADALAVGLSFGTWIGQRGAKTACVGYDGRDSSPGYADAVIEGLRATGIDVTAIGLGPTPMLYYAVKERKTDAGVMVTGSHNPVGYNGFKLMLQTGPVYGTMIQDLGAIAAAGAWKTGAGALLAADVRDMYVDRLLRDYTAKNPLKIAWDCGNGAAGEIVRRLVKKLSGEHILLFDEIDGTFPNHHPDPTVDENLEHLIRAVKSEKCDLGIAFDGDADRIGVVDEKGNILRCDTLIALYAREVLRDMPGATIIGDVKCSQVMYDEIARLGGRPLMWKTGHSLIKAKMYEEKSPLAGELSGHVFFGHKFYGHDDGIYCAIRFLNLIGDNVSGLTSTLPATCNTPEIRFEVDEENKFALVADIAEWARTLRPSVLSVSEIDGVRVTTPDGWWLLRASNTENALVARAESADGEGLARLKSMIADACAHIGLTVSL